MSEGADRLQRIEDAVLGLSVRLGAMQATLEGHLRQQAERTACRDLRCADHEDRIRTLAVHEHRDLGGQLAKLGEQVEQVNRWRWMLAGAGAVLGGAGLKGIEALAKLAAG